MTAVFTNGGGDLQWDMPANWAGGVLPAPGEDVQFPAFTGYSTTVNVATPVTVGSLSLDHGDLFVGGAEITLLGNLFASGFANGANNIRLTHDTVVTLAPNQILNLYTISDGGNGYKLEINSGNHRLEGTSTYTGDTHLSDGIGTVSGTHASRLVVDGAEQLYTYGGTFGGLDAGAATIHLDDLDNGAQVMTSGGTVVMTSATTLREPFYADAGVEYAGQFVATGTSVTLGDATLDLLVGGDFGPSLYHDVTILSNQTGSPVSGTFAGLPEGSIVDFNGVPLRITYAGGASGQDVVLRILSYRPNVVSASSGISTSSFRPSVNVLAEDPIGGPESGITYTWSVDAAPAGARAVRFANNGTNASKNVQPRFFAPGTYTLLCTMTGPTGATSTRTVEVTIKQKATGIRVSPHEMVMTRGATQQYGAYVYDQFGGRMRWGASVLYTLEQGPGTLSSTGLFTSTGGRGHVVVRATIRNFSGVAGATIV